MYQTCRPMELTTAAKRVLPDGSVHCCHLLCYCSFAFFGKLFFSGGADSLEMKTLVALILLQVMVPVMSGTLR